MKITLWIFKIISMIGIVFSIVLIVMGNKPCSGDGCIIHVLYITGGVLLVFSLLVFGFTTWRIRKFRKSGERDDDSQLENII